MQVRTKIYLDDLHHSNLIDAGLDATFSCAMSHLFPTSILLTCEHIINDFTVQWQQVKMDIGTLSFANRSISFIQCFTLLKLSLSVTS